MADPFTIGLVLASGAASALGSVVAGEAANQASQYNAQVAEQNAERVRTEAAAKAERSVRQSRQVLGTQRAAVAQSGFGFTGSMSDLITTSETNADLDALTIAYEGEAAARGYQNQAQLDRMQGKNAKTAGYIGAATSLLSTGVKGYGRFKKGTYSSKNWDLG